MNALILAKRIVLLLGIGVGTIMSGAHLRGALVPCLSNSDCGTVLNSAFSKVGGIPVATIGVLYFLCIWFLDAFMLSASDHVKAGKAWLVSYRLQIAGLLVAIAFSAAGNLYLRVFCILCFILSICILASFFLTLRCSPSAPTTTPKRAFASAALALTVVVGAGAYSATLSPRPKVVDAEAVSKTSPSKLAPPNRHYVGNPDAKNIVVIFSDMQCPVCESSFTELVPRFRNAKRFKLVFRHRPLESHQFATKLAVVAEICTSEEDFWARTEAIIKRHVWNEADFNEIKRKLLSRPYPWSVEVKAGDMINEDLDLARSLKISGTPIHILIEEGKAPKVVSVREILSRLDELEGR